MAVATVMPVIEGIPQEMRLAAIAPNTTPSTANQSTFFITFDVSE